MFKRIIISVILVGIIGCQPALGVVNSTAVPERFPANGSATTFNFTFRLTDQTELVALVRNDSTGVDTDLTLNVDYTLAATNNNFNNGGTLTTTITYASGNTLILHREALRTQTVNLIQGQAMPAEATELTLDKQTLAIQDIDKNLGFAITVPFGDPTSALDLELPNSVDRASKNLTFRANGSVTATLAVTGVTNISAFGEDLVSATTAVAARNTLFAANAITPEQHGAVADGVTDDSIAFQAAIDALTEGQVIRLTDGKTYYLGTTQINWPATLDYSGIICDGQAFLKSDSTTNVLSIISTNNTWNVFEGFRIQSDTAKTLFHITGEFFQHNSFNRLHLKGDSGTVVQQGLCFTSTGNGNFWNMFNDLVVAACKYNIVIGHDFVAGVTPSFGVAGNRFINVKINSYETHGFYVGRGWVQIHGINADSSIVGATSDITFSANSGQNHVLGAFIEPTNSASNLVIKKGSVSNYFQGIIVSNTVNPGQEYVDENPTAVSVPFTSGGTTGFAVGDTVVGGTSAASGTVNAVTLTSGTYAGGDAVGILVINSTTTATYVDTEALKVSTVDEGTASANETNLSTGVRQQQKTNTVIWQNNPSLGSLIASQSMRTALIEPFAGEDLTVVTAIGRSFVVKESSLANERFKITNTGAFSFPRMPGFTDNSATPYVTTGKVILVNNSSATTITDLLGGTAGQEVTLLFTTANTTMDFSAGNMFGNGGMPWKANTGDSMFCTFRNDKWYCVVSKSVNSDEILLGTATVDLQNGDSKTTVFTVPTGKSAIITRIVIHSPTASLAGGTDFDIGSGANADTWLQANNLSTMTAATDYMVITSSATKYTLEAAAAVFGIKPSTGATADAQATMEVFGYLK